MRISVVYSASRGREVHVMRMMDGRRRRLVVATGFDLRPAEIATLAEPLVTAEELAELRRALGLNGGDAA